MSSKKRFGAPLSNERIRELKTLFNSLIEAPRQAGSIDPVDHVQRWTKQRDIEVAAVISSQMAFGKVSAFWPKLELIMNTAALHGGPYQWVKGDFDWSAIKPLRYRWVDGIHIAMLAKTAVVAIDKFGSLEELFTPKSIVSGTSKTIIRETMTEAMDRSIGSLQDISVELAEDFQLSVTCWTDMPRAFKHFMSRPSKGSGCKRWCMFTRWMVRTPTTPHDVDFGIWAIDPSQLIIPLDTHVHRISKLIGLTTRNDASWKTAIDVTESLKQIDPTDPIKYDFAIAHVGISQGCQGQWAQEICGECPIKTACDMPLSYQQSIC